ncbi:MAG: hypothetical protein JSS95_17390 [Acidobacteria bacterium]|nr:hypothetical protein [Acidobacteriota bacterium]
MTSESLPSAVRAGRAIGAMFFAFFGAAWLIVGCVHSGHGTVLVIVPVVLCAIALFAFAYFIFKRNSSALAARTGSPQEKRRSRIFNIVNAVQWILILIISNVLANLHLSAWIIPAIMIIVGLHFLPLAGLFDYPPHYLTGTTFILIAVLYPFLSQRGPQSPIGCYLAGAVLWLSAAYGLTLAPVPSRS